MLLFDDSDLDLDQILIALYFEALLKEIISQDELNPLIKEILGLKEKPKFILK